MKSRQVIEATKLIKLLVTGKFYCECPCGCGEEINLKNAGLFYLNNLTSAAEKERKMMLDELKEQQSKLKVVRSNMTKRAQLTTKSVNIGFILERLAPSLKSFRFSHNDCRSLFDPIDYVIFEGLSKNKTVNKIIFTDIKSGAASLKSRQKEIKSLVQNKKVEFRTY
ncbi:MAG: Holliday junction resolvase-like protein [Candidatus Paceibacterota bacterium]|jgi:predicted Holliday junction resolvase-like endonuclease